MIVAQFRDGHLHRLIEADSDGSWTVPADSTPTDTFTVFQTPYTFPAPHQDGTSSSTQADIETIISDLPPWWAGAATLATLIVAAALTLVGLAYLADWIIQQVR